MAYNNKKLEKNNESKQNNNSEIFDFKSYLDTKVEKEHGKPWSSLEEEKQVETVKESLKEYQNEKKKNREYQEWDVSDNSTSNIEKVVLDIVPDEDDEKVNYFINLIENIGLLKVVKMIEKEDDGYHLLDDFHKILVQYLKTIADKTIIGSEEEKKKVDSTLFEVILPLVPAAKEKKPEERIREMAMMMSQFYAGMTTVCDKDSMSLELASVQNFVQVKIFVSIPNKKVIVFKNQILSIFPNATLIEKKEDYNIFNKTKNISAGYFELKDYDIFSIKTIDEFGYDPLNVILTSLANLNEDQGAAIQLILKEAPSKIYNDIQKKIDKINDGKPIKEALGQKKSGIDKAIDFINKNVFGIKEAKKDKPSDPTKRAFITETMKKKIKSQLFHINFNVIVSAETQEMADLILDGIISSFAQFDNPNGARFEFKKISSEEKEKDKFVDNYIFRVFDGGKKVLMNTDELSTVIHFPKYKLEAGNIINTTGVIKSQVSQKIKSTATLKGKRDMFVNHAQEKRVELSKPKKEKRKGLSIFQRGIFAKPERFEEENISENKNIQETESVENLIEEKNNLPVEIPKKEEFRNSEEISENKQSEIQKENNNDFNFQSLKNKYKSLEDDFLINESFEKVLGIKKEEVKPQKNEEYDEEEIYEDEYDGEESYHEDEYKEYDDGVYYEDEDESEEYNEEENVEEEPVELKKESSEIENLEKVSQEKNESEGLQKNILTEEKTEENLIPEEEKETEEKPKKGLFDDFQLPSDAINFSYAPRETSQTEPEKKVDDEDVFLKSEKEISLNDDNKEDNVLDNFNFGSDSSPKEEKKEDKSFEDLLASLENDLKAGEEEKEQEKQKKIDDLKAREEAVKRQREEELEKLRREISEKFGYKQVANAQNSVQGFNKVVKNLIDENIGIVIGLNDYQGEQNPIYYKPLDRLRHMYVIGQTGTGKTTFLKNMIVQDIENGEGICFIDPHGSDIEDILANIPPERFDDVIYFDPAHIDDPMALNMLEYDPKKPEQKTFIVNEMLSIFNKLFDMKSNGGAMFEMYFRNSVLLAIDDPNDKATLLDVTRIFSDADFRAKKLKKCKNIVPKQFWEKIATKVGGDASLENVTPYITSKFDGFLANDYMRPIVTQGKSSLDFRWIMDNKKILLVNLAKGRIGDINANLLGMIIVGKLFMAAMSRVDSDISQLPPFYVYLDEFQNITTDTISQILSEARKYKLSLNIAHQYIKQIDEKIRNAVFGNVGSMTIFRVGAGDGADVLAKQLEPVYTEFDIVNLPNRNAYIRLMMDGEIQPPFNIATFPPKQGNKDQISYIKKLSWLKYGGDRDLIEEKVRLSMDF